MSIEAAVGLVVGLLTIGGVLAGLAVSWGRLGSKVTQMEKEIAKLEALEKEVTAIDSRQRESAKGQGERLEKATIELAVLRGAFDGFERGRKSRSTAATGHAIPQAPGTPGKLGS